MEPGSSAQKPEKLYREWSLIVLVALLVALFALGVRHQTDQCRDPDQQDQTAGIDAGDPEAGSCQQWNAYHRDQAGQHTGDVAPHPGCHEDGKQEEKDKGRKKEKFQEKNKKTK